MKRDYNLAFCPICGLIINKNSPYCPQCENQIEPVLAFVQKEELEGVAYKRFGDASKFAQLLINDNITKRYNPNIDITLRNDPSVTEVILSRKQIEEYESKYGKVDSEHQMKVLQENLEDNRRRLAKITARYRDAQNTNTAVKRKCPVCGSTNVRTISMVKRAGMGAMFGLFSKTARSQFECLNCKNKF